MNNYLAIDIGAESGRMILGTATHETLTLREIHRFPNGMLNIHGKCHWNIGQIYKEIINGLEKCVSVEKVIPESIGIDTWGVDYVLLTGDGTLLGMPYSYRDTRTQHAIEEFTTLIPANEIYKLTGTLLAPYNTLFQLYAAKKTHPELLHCASDLLFIPDLLTFFLTGNKKTERSFASTSQLYSPFKKSWEEVLFHLLGLPIELMQEITESESHIGYLNDAVCLQTGMKKIPVIAVATHDTNSAVTAIPATSDNWAFISSGTWSLMGYESKVPHIDDLSFKMNFTNECGIRDSYQILKNHMGFWPLQECRKCWKKENYTYDRLVEMASSASPFTSFIDIDNNDFLNPSDMPDAINVYLKRSNQKGATDHGHIIRIILESLALKYRQTLDQIELLRGKAVDELYITGGGIRNDLLCQFTANATGRPLNTGLAEGSAAGNILIQALANGQFSSIKEIRELVKRSCNSKIYNPENISKWNNAFNQYSSILYNQLK